MKILVIEDPKKCSDCPCYNSKQQLCQVTNMRVNPQWLIPDWCELKPELYEEASG